MATQTRKPLFNNEHVSIPGADLYRGDCLAVLPGLAGPFDAVVTDPPYSSGGQSKGDRGRFRATSTSIAAAPVTQTSWATPRISAATCTGRRYGWACVPSGWPTAA